MLIRILNREVLQFSGWTSIEAQQMQHFMDEVWLPAAKQMLSTIHSPEKVVKVINVIKTHMVIRHASDRLVDIGGVKVCPTQSLGLSLETHSLQLSMNEFPFDHEGLPTTG